VEMVKDAAICFTPAYLQYMYFILKVGSLQVNKNVHDNNIIAR